MNYYKVLESKTNKEKSSEIYNPASLQYGEYIHQFVYVCKCACVILLAIKVLHMVNIERRRECFVGLSHYQFMVRSIRQYFIEAFL